jgi:hypothetical protein
MSELKIQFGRPVSATGAAVVPLEIIGADMRRLDEPRVLRLDRYQDVTVPPGAYLVRVHLPSGELVSTQVDVKDGESKWVVLAPVSESPSESLGWAYYAKSITRAGLGWAGPRQGYWVGEVIASAGGTRPLPDSGGPVVREVPPPRLDLWSHDPIGGWLAGQFRAPNAVDTSPRREDPRLMAHLQLQLPLGQHWLQVQPGDSVRAPIFEASKFVALPASQRGVEVLVIYDAAPAQADPLNVIIHSANPQAEAVLAYLTEGAYVAARAVAGEVVDQAERWLRDDPVSATIAGYYLLRAGRTAGRHDWTAGLADDVPWLPDGCAIHGWQLLHQDQPDADRARRRFLQAEGRGLPLFTQGLRLLLDGLGMFDHRSHRGDVEVRDALDHLRPYAAAADWTTPTTTFFGPTPTLPRPRD